MIVLCVTNCPSQLRGDLTKWLIEVNTGVYVGRLNARVREELWKRVCGYIKNGQASMIYSTNSEQGYSFKTHNSTWQPNDFEGITLIKKLRSVDYSSGEEMNIKKGFSKAAKYQMMRKTSTKNSEYVSIDIETTGLNPIEDRIIEIGIVRINGGIITEKYQCFINTDHSVPKKILELTGITEEQILEGISEDKACKDIIDFIGKSMIIGYNVQFDISFFEQMAERTKTNLQFTKCKDVLMLARRKLKGLNDYKLETVATYCKLESSVQHRALEDSILTHKVFEKLNEI